MKPKWLILAFAVSALLSFLWIAPANHLYHWFAPQDMPAGVHGISGTVFSGRADRVQYQNLVVAQNIEWRMRPTELLRLSVGWRLRFAGPASGQLDARVSANGKLSVQRARLIANVDALMRAAGYDALPVRGQLGAQIDELRLDPRSGLPTKVVAEASLRDLAWALGENPLQVGHFRARVRTDREGVLRAEIGDDEDSPVEAEGEAMLRPDRVYETHIRVRAREGAPEQTRNLLQLIGQPDNQGIYHLRQRGSL